MLRVLALFTSPLPLRWRHNGHDSVSNHQPHHYLLSRLIRCRSKKTSKYPRHWPLCGEFTGDRGIPAQMASNAENVSIWWRHHDYRFLSPSFSSAVANRDTAKLIVPAEGLCLVTSNITTGELKIAISISIIIGFSLCFNQWVVEDTG